MFRLALTVVMLSGCCALAADAKPVVFTFDDPNNRDTTRFVLEAPFETINGLSNSLEGSITVSGKTAAGELKVLVRSLRTGNSARDGHLAGENWLDSRKNPFITFAFKDLDLPADLKDNTPVELKAKGTFQINGVSREEAVEVTLSMLKENETTKVRHSGDLLHVKAKFKIGLENYKLETRRALFLKVGEIAELNVDAYGSTALGKK